MMIPIVMGARGYRDDGTGGEIDIFWKSTGRSILLLKPSKFSYWLFNTFSHWLWKRR